MRVDSNSTDSVVPTGDGIGRSLTRYDLLLAVVPLVFAVCLGTEWALSLPDRTGVVAASLVAAAVLADALFVNPPRA